MRTYYEREMKSLVGESIRAAYVNEDKTAIRFETTTGQAIYVALGDCCSHSWIEHLSGLDALVAGTVTAAEEISIGEEFDQGGDVIRPYGVKITTTLGIATIEFRNASNGYYDGYLERYDEYEPAPQIPVNDDF